MGYVDPGYAEIDTQLAIDIIGVRSPAVVRQEPMFDPAHERPRS
ncbi:MAG: glycine cleavage system aminomethyltransferase GcvT, partial [Acidimicrobiia bacterium]|nr:glycine cleavage system aminomethyltransferase GcvT [Acidimicrobiia bacterium]NNL27636.1 glycine cleavage system aminomethyltransferase GcvT [Acidimicrobiia bacterium]